MTVFIVILLALAFGVAFLVWHRQQGVAVPPPWTRPTATKLAPTIGVPLSSGARAGSLTAPPVEPPAFGGGIGVGGGFTL